MCSENEKPHNRTERRVFLRNVALSLISFSSYPVLADTDSNFSTYRGPISLGYSFSYPSTWSVKKKPIRTHLSEVIVSDTNDSSSSVGIIVDSVKIESIDKIGTPEDVGQKVIGIEKKKDSVKDAFVSSARSVNHNGLTYYLLDYTVDSTRGYKRYLAKATVTGRQLYVFTAQAKVDNLKGDTEKSFSQMLDSFNVVQQYLQDSTVHVGIYDMSLCGNYSYILAVSMKMTIIDADAQEHIREAGKMSMEKYKQGVLKQF